MRERSHLRRRSRRKSGILVVCRPVMSLVYLQDPQFLKILPKYQLVTLIIMRKILTLLSVRIIRVGPLMDSVLRMIRHVTLIVVILLMRTLIIILPLDRPLIRNS